MEQYHKKEVNKTEKVKWNTFLQEIHITCIAPNEYERTLTKQKLHAKSNANDPKNVVYMK